jgi:hypothetical protein
MGEFTEKVAAAHSLRSTKVIKAKLFHMSGHFDDLNQFIVGEIYALIGSVEELEKNLEEARAGEVVL